MGYKWVTDKSCDGILWGARLQSSLNSKSEIGVKKKSQRLKKFVEGNWGEKKRGVNFKTTTEFHTKFDKTSQT